MLSRIAALGMIGAIVFGLQYANREGLLAWLAGQPYLLNLRDGFLLSDTASLLTGLLATLIGTYIIWSLWQWWYTRWTRWLGIERQTAVVEAVVEKVAPSESWQAEQARLHRSKRGLPPDEPAASSSVSVRTTNHRLLWIFLALVAVATLALVGALQLYNAFGSQLSGRDIVRLGAIA